MFIDISPLRRHRNDDESWTTTCSSPPAARSARSSHFQSRRRSCLQASEEVVDIDDLFLPKRQCIAMMGWPRGSARHDGRLPLQVLGDIGVVDLVKRHHLWSHLLVQNDDVVVGQTRFQMSKGWLGSADWTEEEKNIFNHCHDHLNHHNWPLPASITWELAPSDCKDKVEQPPTNWAEQFLSLWLGFVNKNQPYLFLGKILFLKRCSSYLFQPGGITGARSTKLSAEYSHEDSGSSVARGLECQGVHGGEVEEKSSGSYQWVWMFVLWLGPAKITLWAPHQLTILTGQSHISELFLKFLVLK